MHQYLNVLQKVLISGEWRENRTGIRTKMIDGAMLQFDLRQGFPAITTKKLAFKQVVGELLGFIRGVTNAAGFRELGCNIWDANANENKTWLDSMHRTGEDDLGRIYGAQWRRWEYSIDQLDKAVRDIVANPQSRRIIVTAWQPSELDHMALPPCHLLFQFLADPETKQLSLCMYQRSCDMFLGVPFNIASYALLLELVSRATGYTAKNLTMFLADVHIYENHLDQVATQLARAPLELCKIEIAPSHHSGMTYLVTRTPDSISLKGYVHHEAIKAPMAV